MKKDYYNIAYRGFRAVSWIWILFLVFGLLGLIGQSYGRTPSAGVRVWVLQAMAQLVLSLISARLLKKRESLAIWAAYATLGVNLILSIILFSIVPKTLVGIVSIIIFVYLLVAVVGAQKQLKK